MENLKIFRNESFGEVRVVEQDGAPWFVGKDVATMLGYNDTSRAMQRHVDSEDKLTGRFVWSGQNRAMYIINESGLYSLILSSKLPTAKQFKRWVTSEILPTIRKTGAYAVQTHDRAKAIAEIAAAQERMEQVEAAVKAIANVRDKNRQIMNQARQAYQEHCEQYNEYSDLLEQHRRYVASLIKRENLLATADPS